MRKFLTNKFVLVAGTIVAIVGVAYLEHFPIILVHILS